MKKYLLFTFLSFIVLTIISMNNFATVSAADWKTDANARIEQIRKRDAQIKVVDNNNYPVSGVNLQVKQVKKSFPFGSAINKTVLTNTNYQNFFKSHYNWAVFENETKWYYNQPSQGNVTYADADAMYNFCQTNGIPVRGHCVLWEPQKWQPNWVQSLTGSNLQTAIDSRINSSVTHFRDKFKHWDVNNEMLHGTFYIDRLGSSIRPYVYQKARQYDPNVRLFVNDFNILSVDKDFTNVQTDEYVSQIQNLINQGAPIDAIGIQGHIWYEDILSNPTIIKTRLDKVATLNKPIWITEFDVADADATVRANKLELIYRTAYSHPMVEGIMMWGFYTDHWRGANAALVNSSWVLNEEGKRFEALMNEWTTNTSGVTDGNGTFTFRGFHGTYEITLTAPGANPITKTITVEPGSDTQIVTLQINGSPTTPTPTPTPVSNNLVNNPGLETGSTSGWSVNGAGTIAVSTAQKHTGTYSLLHTGRTASWNGPLQNITSKVQSGITYNCSAWVRLDNTTSASVLMTIKKTDGSGTSYTNIASATANNGSWVQLSGNYTLTVSGTLTELSIYFEGPGSGVNLFIDDVLVTGGTISTPTPTPTPTPGNLITNPGLETGNTSGWTVNGAGTIAASTAQKHSGTYSLYHTGRTATWNGPIQNITSKVQNGNSYACSGYVRLDNASSGTVTMSIKKTDGSGTSYTNIASATGSNSSWVQLSGNYALTVSGTLTELSIYFEGPGSGVNLYLDDVLVQ